MIRRICFIGDSHVAALKLGTQSTKVAAFKDRMDIFGSRGDSLSRAVIRDAVLTSDDEDVRKSFKNSGGRESVDLTAYDAFCVVGCGAGLKSVKKVCMSYTSYTLGLPDRQLVSDALFDALLVNLYKRSIANMLIEMLAEATDKPIYIIPEPLWSPTALDDKRGVFLNEIVERKATAACAKWLSRNLTTTFGDRATVMHQPADTVQNNCFTMPIYASGSVRLARRVVEHPETDFAHMNGDYGARVLEAFFAKIDVADGVAAMSK